MLLTGVLITCYTFPSLAIPELLEATGTGTSIAPRFDFVRHTGGNILHSGRHNVHPDSSEAGKFEALCSMISPDMDVDKHLLIGFQQFRIIGRINTGMPESMIYPAPQIVNSIISAFDGIRAFEISQWISQNWPHTRAYLRRGYS